MCGRLYAVRLLSDLANSYSSSGIEVHELVFRFVCHCPSCRTQTMQTLMSSCSVGARAWCNAEMVLSLMSEQRSSGRVPVASVAVLWASCSSALSSDSIFAASRSACSFASSALLRARCKAPLALSSLLLCVFSSVSRCSNNFLDASIAGTSASSLLRAHSTCLICFVTST